MQSARFVQWSPLRLSVIMEAIDTKLNAHVFAQLKDK